MIRRTWPVFASVLLFAVLSCPIDTHDSTVPSDQAPADFGGLEITYQPEDGQAVSATVTAAQGGRLTATSSSGVILDLMVPTGAVDADHTISMTPLSQLTFTPLDGEAHDCADCVQGCLLGPDGLEFDEPATLTVTYPDAGLGCLPDSTYRIVAFSETSAFYEILPTTWDAAARSLTCEVRHFSGYGVDQMSDYEFLRYLITEASRHAQEFPGEDDLARLLSYAEEAALHGWQDLVDLAVAGGQAVLDLLATSAIDSALKDPGPVSRQSLIHYLEVAQRWGYDAVEARLLEAMDQHARAYAERGHALCQQDKHAEGRAILAAALEWAMAGDIQGNSQAFVTQVQQWLDGCCGIAFSFGADKGEVYNMVLEPEDRDRAQVTFTATVTSSSGDGLAGKSVQIYWDKMQAGKFAPMPGGYGSTGDDGTFSVVQGASSVLGIGGCLASKTVHYYAEVYHDETWRPSQTISVTYRQLMIYTSISYEFSYDASQDSYVATAAASLLGEGTSPNGCTGAADCDGLLSRSYTRDRGYDTTTSVEEDSRIPACRASLEYSVQQDPVTGATYLTVSGIRVRDLDEIFHDLTVETCRSDGGCTTSAGYNVGLCDPDAGPSRCNPINSSVVYWSPEAIGDLVFPMVDGKFEPFNWSNDGQYGSASLNIVVACGYGN